MTVTIGADHPSATSATIDVDELAEVLGVDELRPRQVQSIEALVGGRDVLAVIPTGGGKSAIYQGADHLLDGITVVVSPLLALQADQIDSIERNDLAAAVSLDGSCGAAERRDRLDALADGSATFLFATPEILGDDDVTCALAETGVSLFVVDEAHCIVTWGQGFRPDFLLLGDVRRRLGSPTTVALTGSADPMIRADICRALDMGDVEIVTDALERTNISLSVVSAPTRAAAAEAMTDHVVQESGTKALVYVPTRKLCAELSEQLSSAGRAAMPFHGGLKRSEKDAALDFIRDSDDAVVVATTAFGMGIDISDISTVVHLDMPDSLLNYYQEIGRSGRDGRPSRGAVFVSLRSKSRRAFGSGVRATTVADCHAAYWAIDNGASTRRDVVDATKLSTGRIARALAVLQTAGVVTTTSPLSIMASSDPEAIEEICRRREEFDRSQIAAVERYRSSRRCRWAQILASLGEATDRCGHCDVCDEESETSTSGAPGGSTDGVRTESPCGYTAGDRVEHDEFGVGSVTWCDDVVVAVTFDDVGPKELSTEMCRDEELIRPVGSPDPSDG